MPKEKFKVVSRDPKMKVATEVITESILEISRGVKVLRDGRLNEEAIVTLLHRACPGLSRSAIEVVLRGLYNLECIYLKPTKP